MILKNFMRHFLMPVILLFTALLMTTNIARAGSNFTMLDNTGALVGGTNDVTFTWDGTLNTDPATAVVNASIASAGPTPFFGLNWTAYNVKVYGPGSYTISTADVSGDPTGGCPTGAPKSCASGGNYNVTVGAGQIMAHMKFAWGTTEGIDVVNVWEVGSWTAFNPTDSIWTGAGGSYTGPIYSLVSTDWNGDNNAGAGMIDGPFAGFNANFNVKAGGAGGTGVTPSPEVTEAPDTKLPGCSISMTSVNPLDRGDWWLVAGFLGWLAATRRKFGRANN